MKALLAMSLLPRLRTSDLADPAAHVTAAPVRVFGREWMAALAMRLLWLLRSMSGAQVIVNRLTGSGDAIERVGRDVIAHGCFSHGHLDTEDRHEAIIALVVGLLVACGPAAIVGAVVPVGIYSVNRPALWARSHVSHEGFDGVSPALADSDASAAVVPERPHVLVVATVLHYAPDAIQRAFGKPVSSYLVKDLRAVTATALYSGAQIIGGDTGFVPAVAATYPAPMPSAFRTDVVRSNGNDGETAET